MLAVEVARGVKQREQAMGLNVMPGPADSAIYAAENGMCIADDMAGQGIKWTPADKSPGARCTGWEALRKRLKAAMTKPGEPMEYPGLFVFDTCRHFIRTVPTLQRDDKKPDDVDTNAEDHVADEVRYRVLAVRKTAKVLEFRV